MKKLSYSERLTIPIDGGLDVFATKGGLVVAKGYVRVVIGGRGPYIEFSDSQIVHGSIHVPEAQRHRIGNDMYFYDEYRSNDSCNVKLYRQKNTVSYADYQPAMWYISPELLVTKDNDCLLLPAYADDCIANTLFDFL